MRVKRVRTRTWPRASRILQAGKVGRRLKLIEVRQEEGKEIRTEVDAFVEVEAQDQITEVGTKEAEESPLIADMPTPTTLSLQVRCNQKLRLFLKLKRKRKKDQFSFNRKSQKQFLFDFRPSGKEVVESPSLQSEGKLPQTGTKEGGFFAWLGLLGLGFLGGGAKFARRKE